MHLKTVKVLLFVLLALTLADVYKRQSLYCFGVMPVRRRKVSEK